MTLGPCPSPTLGTIAYRAAVDQTFYEALRDSPANVLNGDYGLNIDAATIPTTLDLPNPSVLLGLAVSIATEITANGTSTSPQYHSFVAFFTGSDS
jgi:hypothetical protein